MKGCLALIIKVFSSKATPMTGVEGTLAEGKFQQEPATIKVPLLFLVQEEV